MRRRAVIQMVLIGLVAGAITFAFAYFIPWLPDSASTQADKVDEVFWFVAIICAVIFAMVAGVAVYEGWKFRAPPDDMDDGSPIHGHTGLEIVWTAIPTILVIAMSVFSAVVLAEITDTPAGSKRIEVTAQQFAWSFKYSDPDRTEGELVLEVNKPVELLIGSKDVIHSFWVPEFRMKQDAVPGVTTTLTITPDKVGTYDLICTELCGLGHAVMRTQARVLSSADYAKWAKAPPAGAAGGSGGGTDGKSIFASAGCASCHALAAAGSSAEVGPDLDKVLAGKDEDFIRESIVDPNAEIAQGYQPNVMPSTFSDSLSKEQLDALVKYLKETAGRTR
jgi:cytochrome c oxidase subunit 2